MRQGAARRGTSTVSSATSRRAPPVHGLRGVGAEVHHDLLQLGRVAAAPTASLRRRDAARSATVAGSEARSSSTASATPARTRTGRRSALAAAAEGEDLVDDALRALARRHDLPHVPPARGLPRGSPQRHLGVAEDRAEDVVELVRDAAGERADRLQPLRLAQRAPAAPPARPRPARARCALAKISAGGAQQRDVVVAASASAPRARRSRGSRSGRRRARSGMQSQEPMPRRSSAAVLRPSGSAATPGNVDRAPALDSRRRLQALAADREQRPRARGRARAVRAPRMGALRAGAPAVTTRGAVDAGVRAEPRERRLDAVVDPLAGQVDERGRDAGDQALEGEPRPQARALARSRRKR